LAAPAHRRGRGFRAAGRRADEAHAASAKRLIIA
jgi:hypothetical protein